MWRFVEAFPSELRLSFEYFGEPTSSSLPSPSPHLLTTFVFPAMASQYYRSPLLSKAFPIAAVSDLKDSLAPPPTGLDLYSRFALAGAICCSVTHGGLTPVDVVKTRIQLEPEVYNRVRGSSC